MVNNQVWPMPLLPDSPEITGDMNTATTQILCPLNINFVFGPLPLRQTVGIKSTKLAYGGSPKTKFSSSFPRTVSFIWRWSESASLFIMKGV